MPRQASLFLSALLLLPLAAGCSSSAQTFVPHASSPPSLGGSGPQSGAPSGFYVATPLSDEIYFFPAGSSGNAAPTETVASIASGIALDPVNSDVVVIPPYLAPSVTFYSPQLTSPTSINPSQYISNANAVAEDSNGQLYLSGNLPRGSGDLLAGPGVAIFPPGSGVPSATIQSYNTAFPYDYAPPSPCTNAIAVDPGQNIYVTTSSLNQCPDTIAVYAKGVTGNVAATATIYGSQTGLSAISGIAIGPSDMYVSNMTANTITVYPLNANGNVAPSASIAGSKTLLSYPVAVSVDSGGNVYVLNDNASAGSSILYDGNPYVTIYASGTSGNVAPMVTIGGSATELELNSSAPGGIAVVDSILAPSSMKRHIP